MRISDWSSDVCSSDLVEALPLAVAPPQFIRRWKLIEGQLRLDLVTGSGAVMEQEAVAVAGEHEGHVERFGIVERLLHAGADAVFVVLGLDDRQPQVGLAIQDEVGARSEEHTSELQSLMRISYAVFCLKKKNKNTEENYTTRRAKTK